MAAALAAGMIIPTTVFAAGPVVKVGTDSDVQMSSDPEAVYVNSYSGTERSENFNDNWKFYLGIIVMFLGYLLLAIPAGAGNSTWAMHRAQRTRASMTRAGSR